MNYYMFKNLQTLINARKDSPDIGILMTAYSNIISRHLNGVCDLKFLGYSFYETRNIGVNYSQLQTEKGLNFVICRVEEKNSCDSLKDFNMFLCYDDGLDLSKILKYINKATKLE